MAVNPVELAGGVSRLPIVEAALGGRRRPGDVLRIVERHDAAWHAVYAATNAGDPAKVGAALVGVLNPDHSRRLAPAADLARAWRLLPAALVDTAPRLTMNRSVDDALAHLTDDRPMLAAAANRRAYGGDTARYDRRVATERNFGVHGDGADAGRTIFTSVQFGDEITPLPYMQNLVSGMPNPGAWSFGRVALDLRHRLAPRATVSPADLFDTGRAERIGGVEQLRSITMDRLVADGELMRELARVDDATAQRTLSLYLRSSALAPYGTRSPGYLESQVRGGGTVGDVERATVDARIFGEWVPPHQRLELADAARARGILTRFASPEQHNSSFTPNPHPKDWWMNIGGHPRSAAT